MTALERDSFGVTESLQGAAAMTNPARRPIHERLAQEAPLAVGTVLFRAHDALRHVENVLELEATDPDVAELHGQAKSLRKAIAAKLVDVAIDGAAERLEVRR